MKNENILTPFEESVNYRNELFGFENTLYPNGINLKSNKFISQEIEPELAELLFITSYPPRECGIATYSQDLIKALNHKFNKSLSIKVCALESGESNFQYTDDVKYVLNTSSALDFGKLALSINKDNHLKIVILQHEFGFYKEQENSFLPFLRAISKPVIIVFHTVLPNPNEELKFKIQNIAEVCSSIIVMTHNSADILMNDYGISSEKLTVIAHGTHLVPHLSEIYLKAKYGLQDKKILTTFGLLSSGKSIETTIDSLPSIIKKCPEVVFLVIGKTHPEVKKRDGESYRESLESKVKELSLEKNVKFINNYLGLPELLEYLQLTDIYIFTTNDPNQAVSGTFAYAMSCACPIISTPIPHAREVLNNDTGIIFDFRNSEQLSDGVISLLNDEPLRRHMSSNTLQKIVSTAWENSAVAHAMLFQRIAGDHMELHYNLPEINLHHLKEMTTAKGIIQFSKINQPDLSSGYTLDDNARALIAMCMYYENKIDENILDYIVIYFNFIKSCIQPAGDFLNYIDQENQFTSQNNITNLDDANGRAIWALGYMVSMKGQLPMHLITEAEILIEKSLQRISSIHSTRAMAFTIKGLYYYNGSNKAFGHQDLLITFANRLVQMYKHESNKNWEWFEGYLTYANSVLPEAMLMPGCLQENLYIRKLQSLHLIFFYRKYIMRTV
jgi:glycosyltransferase involved in cell wall biosynthesis